MTSQEYMQQMNEMGDVPDFKTQLTQAYEKPVLRPIVDERAELESKYLPTVFNSFTGGTEASDMSPAAKLAMMGGNLGRLTSKIGANQDIQGFYGMQIDNLARSQTQDWQNRYNRLRDMYGMAFQREEAEKAAAARRAAAAAQANQMSALQSLYGGGGGGTLGTNGEGLEIELGTPSSLGELNAKRELSGRSPLTKDYYNKTWSAPSRNQKTLSHLDHIKMNVNRQLQNPFFKAGLNAFRNSGEQTKSPAQTLASAFRAIF